MAETTADRKARKSANDRLKRHQDDLQQAYQLDLREGPAGKQRHQWRVVTGWLMSEARSATDGNRQNMLEHLVQCAQDLNSWSRPSG